MSVSSLGKEEDRERGSARPRDHRVHPRGDVSSGVRAVSPTAEPWALSRARQARDAGVYPAVQWARPQRHVDVEMVTDAGSRCKVWLLAGKRPGPASASHLSASTCCGCDECEARCGACERVSEARAHCAARALARNDGVTGLRARRGPPSGVGASRVTATAPDVLRPNFFVGL
jgi:hypothetical protein